MCVPPVLALEKELRKLGIITDAETDILKPKEFTDAEIDALEPPSGVFAVDPKDVISGKIKLP